MIELTLDLLPDYISFEFQSTQSDGTKFNPTGTPTASIYEEGGADANYDNSQIAGSPFNMAQINGKTGNYGVLVDKSLFTTGKIYRVLFEAMVDGKAAAQERNYHFVNSASMKANVTNLDAAVSSRAPANEYDTELDANMSTRATPAQVATALTNYDGPTRTEATADKDEILVGTDANFDEIGDVKTQLDRIEPVVNTILIDTNEMQLKLPLNFIMGSSVTSDKDDEIDAIKVDTTAIQAQTDLLPPDPTSETLATANKNEIIGAALGYWLTSFSHFTYDGSGRVQTISVNIGDDVTPTRQHTISFTYDVDGNVTDMDIEVV